MSTRIGRKPSKPHVRIRMYNVGFGDCFLLRIPTDEGERRMLIDCGFHSQGKGKFGDAEIVEQIKADLNGQGLSVVLATHRHQDHISGFGEKDLWADVAVDEVWLPFTADPEAAKDEPALRAWQGLMDGAHAICDGAGNLTPEAVSALSARDDAEREAARFMLWNARANAPAIENLLHGFKRADGRPSKRRFLPEIKDRYPSSVDSPALPGVTFRVLGPPVEPEFRRKRKVPSSWGFDEAGATSPSRELDSPFSSDWQVPPAKLPSRKPFADKTLETMRLFNDDLLYAAKALDGFLNGESIVLVIEVGRARLLFTGDAEVGAWNKILGAPEALAIASGATFLKVGHHGSHNATPMTFVNQQIAKETAVVISTQEGPGTYRNGIPLDRMLTAMTGRAMPFARSDRPPVAGGRLFTPDPAGRWVDCEVPC